MFDFIITILITLFTQIYIIIPYWDKLKKVWIMEGYSLEQISSSYQLLCVASYLFIGCIVYGIIYLIKIFVKKLG